MKNLIFSFLIFLNFPVFANTPTVSDLVCSASVQKAMISTAAPLSPIENNGKALGVIWEWQSFVVYVSDDNRLGVVLGDSRLGSFKGVSGFGIKFVTDWPTPESDFVYSYNHPAVGENPSLKDTTYTLTCRIK